MANMDELTTEVLHGLERCGMDQDFIEDCGDCPYRHKDDDFCISLLCRDARTVILHQDKLLQQMEESEPRLVTLDDFDQPPAYDGVLPCWKESRSKTRKCGWTAIVYGKALQDMEMGVARYWTGVPTEEQRREMAWPNI